MGGAINSPSTPVMTIRITPAIAVHPAIRIVDTPAARTTMNSSVRARLPNASRAPINAAIGNRSNAYFGRVRPTIHECVLDRERTDADVVLLRDEQIQTAQRQQHEQHERGVTEHRPE